MTQQKNDLILCYISDRYDNPNLNLSLQEEKFMFAQRITLFMLP